jgi:acetyl esterase/lipase
MSGEGVTEWRISRAEPLEKLRHLYPIPGPIPESVTETMHDVPTRDGSSIRVRVYQPVNGPPEGGSPLIMMYHEGGWCLGDLTDEDLNCRMFTRDLGAVCVNVEYRYITTIPHHHHYHITNNSTALHQSTNSPQASTTAGTRSNGPSRKALHSAQRPRAASS